MTTVPIEAHDWEVRTEEPAKIRFVDHFDPWLVNSVTALGFAVPLSLYFWIVSNYSLNVIVGDQFDDLVLIGHSYSHLFDWSSLWAQHNENRILVPNLIVLLLSRTTQFNVQIEEYLSAFMLVGAMALLVTAHKRRSPSLPWLYYCPVAFLAFSLVQYENSLWGFQMAWYLVLLALAAALFLLDRPTLTWIAFAGAVASGIVGSFSSLQGLLIWPAGLIILYHRRRHASFVLGWIVVAVVSGILYFYHFNTNAVPDHQYAWTHPFLSVQFYVYALGDIVGVPDHDFKSGNGWILAFGVVVLVLALGTLLCYGLPRRQYGGTPLGISLICVGLLFAGIVTLGRVVFGYMGASQSRYTTFDLLVPIGIYLVLLDRPAFRRTRDLGVMSGNDNSQRVGYFLFRYRQWTEKHGLRLARWILAGIVLLQVGFGFREGIEGARATYASKLAAADVLENIDHSSDRQIFTYLDFVNSASFVRKQAHMARLHHLTLFANEPGPERGSPPVGP